MQERIRVLYHEMLSNWHIAEALLDKEEHMDYKRCSLLRDHQEEDLKQRLGTEENALLEKWMEHTGQIQDVDCRLCFIRGLSMGLALQSLAAGER